MTQLKELIDYGIIGLLVLLSIMALAYSLERLLFYRSVKLQNFADKKELEIALSNNLSIIATIGSNAPYIGLLGTVLGIMLTFYSLGESGITETKEIMVGLALALKATAMGLVVAIPSIVFYNLLVRKMDVMLTRWDILHANKEI